ncbi:MAG: DUF5947 family protein [Tepidisphaeraceae bacterium]|jgi:hypothetical protein
MTTTFAPSLPPLAGLRKFVETRASEERCELCGKAIAPEHEHLLEPATRRLSCACQPCAILFSENPSARYRRVPRIIQYLPDFQMSDAQWEGLYLPINLAFFYNSSQTERIVATYPSPAGATESLLRLEAWHDLAAANPILGEFEPDVEALLVNRVGPTRDYYRAPIDSCFKLVGLIRSHWRGLSGGTEVWRHINDFFAELKQRSAQAQIAIGGGECLI